MWFLGDLTWWDTFSLVKGISCHSVCVRREILLKTYSLFLKMMWSIVFPSVFYRLLLLPTYGNTPKHCVIHITFQAMVGIVYAALKLLSFSIPSIFGLIFCVVTVKKPLLKVLACIFAMKLCSDILLHLQMETTYR